MEESVFYYFMIDVFNVGLFLLSIIIFICKEKCKKVCIMCLYPLD